MTPSTENDVPCVSCCTQSSTPRHSSSTALASVVMNAFISARLRLSGKPRGAREKSTARMSTHIKATTKNISACAAATWIAALPPVRYCTRVGSKKDTSTYAATEKICKKNNHRTTRNTPCLGAEERGSIAQRTQQKGAAAGPPKPCGARAHRRNALATRDADPQGVVAILLPAPVR